MASYGQIEIFFSILRKGADVADYRLSYGTGTIILQGLTNLDSRRRPEFAELLKKNTAVLFPPQRQHALIC